MWQLWGSYYVVNQETYVKEKQAMKPKTKLIWGIVLVSFGMILLGETTGAFDFEDLLGAILPIAMIAFGIFLIARRRKTVEKTEQTAFSAPPPPPPFSGPVGPTEPAESVSSSQDIGGRQQSYYDSRNYEQDQAWQKPESDDTGKLKYSKTFGDMSIDFSGVKVQSAEISSGIGDLEIRLHGCEMAEKLNRLIISSFIGDIRIYVPSDMPVFAHCSNFVGDIEVMGRRASGFGNSVDAQTGNYEVSAKKLYVACNSFIGDIKFLGP